MIIPASFQSENFESRMMRRFHEELAKEIDDIRNKVIADAVTTFEADLRMKMGVAAIKISEFYNVTHDLKGNMVITVMIKEPGR